jgi:hypothetical protein
MAWWESGLATNRVIAMLVVGAALGIFVTYVAYGAVIVASLLINPITP